MVVTTAKRSIFYVATKEGWVFKFSFFEEGDKEDLVKIVRRGRKSDLGVLDGSHEVQKIDIDKEENFIKVYRKIGKPFVISRIVGFTNSGSRILSCINSDDKVAERSFSVAEREEIIQFLQTNFFSRISLIA